jgi:hypothetical protein
MDLVSADETALVGVGRLLEAAVQVPWVLVPVACKVLHCKRPRLIPMLDNVVLGHYQHALSEPWLAAASVRTSAAPPRPGCGSWLPSGTTCARWPSR